MDPPLAKRSLRPTASMPTTAEVYGQKHGIDPAVQLALQNIGRKSRQNIAQPSFHRTSTAPVVSFNAPSPGPVASGSHAAPAFQTSHEIMEQARGIVNKEAWRKSTRELQPFGSGSDLGSGSGSGSNDVTDSAEPHPHTHLAASLAQIKGGTKRANWDDGDEDEQEDGGGEGEGEGEGTEVDEDEPAPTMDMESTREDEFPPVFQSPHLTQPELFHRPALPQPPSSRCDRLTRGLPSRNGSGTGGRARALGKTVSAPVGGLWGRGGMGDVDMDAGDGVQDGFDISEWAKEEF